MRSFSCIVQYSDIIAVPTDPRVDGWLFMSSPWPTFFICVSYVVLVKVIGPWYMKDRPPFQLRNLLVFYNAAQVVFSTWLFYEVSFQLRPLGLMKYCNIYICYCLNFLYISMLDELTFIHRKFTITVKLLQVIEGRAVGKKTCYGKLSSCTEIIYQY